VSPPTPLLLVLDGNSLLHRAYHAAAMEGLLDRAGRPVWALRGLVGYLARAAAHLRPDAVLVGFDCPRDSARRSEYPAYKAQRPDKPADLSEQIAGAPELLSAAGICTLKRPNIESDSGARAGVSPARAGEGEWCAHRVGTAARCADAEADVRSELRNAVAGLG